MEHQETIPLTVSTDVKSNEFDCLIIVLEAITPLHSNSLQMLNELATSYKKIHNNKFNTGAHVVPCEELEYRRVVFSFTGPLDREYDDVRRITEAAKEGVSCAIRAGAVKPILVLDKLPTLDVRTEVPWTNPDGVCLSALLGALEAAFVPLEAREFSTTPHASIKSVKSRLIQSLAWLKSDVYSVDDDKLTHVAWCLEEGRRVARDIGGGDPERMRAKKITQYLQQEFAKSPVAVKVLEIDAAQYPTTAIVDRGSNDHYRGQIATFEYDTGPEEGGDKQNLFLIGKGITYDTGGHDLKAGGIMVKMSRDKCGAAAVAGIFKVISLLKPKNIGVHGKVALVRNSIGENAYVSDEIVTSRAGVRIRVGNTDAEGRMVMTDLLCKAKEEALNVCNPHLFTIATLTGHVRICYGFGYTALVSNGLATKKDTSRLLQLAGSKLGEMHEISTIRREDYSVYEQSDQDADLSNMSAPIDGRRARGHQSPAAFMSMAAGVDKHSLNSAQPLAYTHLDIAGSNGPCPGIPSAVPVLTFASQYLIQDTLKL